MKRIRERTRATQEVNGEINCVEGRKTDKPKEGRRERK